MYANSTGHTVHIGSFMLFLVAVCSEMTQEYEMDDNSRERVDDFKGTDPGGLEHRPKGFRYTKSPTCMACLFVIPSIRYPREYPSNTPKFRYFCCPRVRRKIQPELIELISVGI